MQISGKNRLEKNQYYLFALLKLYYPRYKTLFGIVKELTKVLLTI